jgi:hypothetical protein
MTLFTLMLSKCWVDIGQYFEGYREVPVTIIRTTSNVFRGSSSFYVINITSNFVCTLNSVLLLHSSLAMLRVVSQSYGSPTNEGDGVIAHVVVGGKCVTAESPHFLKPRVYVFKLIFIECNVPPDTRSYTAHSFMSFTEDDYGFLP